MGAIEQAKAEARAFRRRMGDAARAMIGARVTVGVSCLFALAFGAALVINPQRLPPIGGLTLAQVGLPPLNFGAERQIAGDIVGAANRQGGADALRDFLAAHPDLIPGLNIAGLALALLMLGVALATQMRDWRRGLGPL